METAEARTLTLAGVDTTERRGPEVTIVVSARRGTHPMIARSDVSDALTGGPLARAFEKLELVATLAPTETPLQRAVQAYLCARVTLSSAWSAIPHPSHPKWTARNEAHGAAFEAEQSALRALIDAAGPK